MTRLILHAGTHKTGTTAIQTFAAKNREALRSRGLLYPDYSPKKIPLRNGQHQFAHSLAEAPMARMTPEEVCEMVQHWSSSAAQQGTDLFVSVEALYRYQVGEGSTSQKRRSFLSRVADVLGGFDVEAVLVFRRPDNFIRSLYQELITNQTPRPALSSFIEWANDPSQFRLRYYENACIFRELFPNMRVLVYEDLLQGAGIYENFFSEIGVDISGIPTPGRIRESVSIPQAMVRNYANDFLHDKDAIKKFMKWLQSSEIESLVMSALGGRRFDLWQSHHERRMFLDSRDEDLESLRKNFFPERQILFPPLREEDTLPTVPELPLELKKEVDKYLRMKILK